MYNYELLIFGLLSKRGRSKRMEFRVEELAMADEWNIAQEREDAAAQETGA